MAPTTLVFQLKETPRLPLDFPEMKSGRLILLQVLQMVFWIIIRWIKGDLFLSELEHPFVEDKFEKISNFALIIKINKNGTLYSALSSVVFRTVDVHPDSLLRI